MRLDRINTAASLDNGYLYYYSSIKPKVKEKEPDLFQLLIKPEAKEKEPYILQLPAEQVTQNNSFLLFIVCLFFSISMLNIP